MKGIKKIVYLCMLGVGIIGYCSMLHVADDFISDDDFFNSYNPEVPEPPPIIVEAKLPEMSGVEVVRKPKDAAFFSIDVPVLGVLDLAPFEDVTRTPVEKGFKIAFADKSKHFSLGALDVDEGYVQYVKGKLGMTGQATLYGNRARFGIKDIDFVAEKKFVKRIVLSVDFINRPTFEIIPGVADSKVEITTAELEIERDKPVELRALQKVFGQQVWIKFTGDSDYLNAALALVDTPLNSLITAVNGTPLAEAQVKKAALELKNVYAKDRTQKPFTVAIGATVDLTPTELSSDPQAVSALSMSCAITTKSVDATISAERFPLADIGTINKAAISIKAGSAVQPPQQGTQVPEASSITLTGDLTFNVSDAGNLNIIVASKISRKGLEFLGELKDPLSYLDLKLNKGKVLFDTAKKIVDIVGDLTFQGLALAATFALKPDPVEPKDTTKRTIEFTAKVQTTDFRPFAGTSIPVLNTLAFTNIDAGVELIKQEGKPASKAIKFDGDVEILNVKLRSLIRFVVNDKGQKGVYINAPLPSNWTFSQSIPELKGPIFDGLVFEQASFVASSVDYLDTRTNKETNTQETIAVHKGLEFYAKVPLSGTLQPVADLLGSSGQKFTMFGTITPNNPRAMLFGIKVGEGAALGTNKAKPPIEIGDTEIVISGAPSLGLKANVLVRPSDKDELMFSGEFKLSKKEASLEAMMTGAWNNPFGINGLSLQDVALALGIAYGSPVPTLFGIAAKLQVSSTNTIAFAAVADAGMEHMALKGEANKISLMELINGFAKPMGINIPDPKIPIFDLRDVKVRFAATDTKIGTELIEQGVTMQGKMDLLGQEKAAELDVNIDTSISSSAGIKIKGYTQPINLQGLLKVAGLSGQKSPCKVRIEGGSGQDRPEVDIELTFDRQVFLVQGSMVVGDEASGIFYKTANCLHFSTEGIRFEFLSQIGSNKLLYSHVIGQSSGDITNPQFALKIDFEQHMQQFIKDQVNVAFNAAQKEIVAGINTAQEEINKIDGVIADSAKKIQEAEAQVAAAQKALAPLDAAMAQTNKAIADAQKEVQSIDDKKRALQVWWNGLPDY